MADTADQSSTGQISIGLDTSQFKAGTQAILADIRLLTQGLNQFEVAGNKVGSSFRGLRQASLSLRQFRSAVDADAIPALRKLQLQANASAASLSRVFNIGAQPNNAVSGIQRVTNALAAQERQAMRTADAMARAAMSQNRTGAMAFRNAGRSGSGSFGRGGAGTGAAGTRGARSSLDDSGAAARSIPSIAGISRAALGLELSKRSGMRKAGISSLNRQRGTPLAAPDRSLIGLPSENALLARLSSRELGRYLSRMIASETGDVEYPIEPLNLRNFTIRGNRFGPPKPRRSSGRYGAQQSDLDLFEKAIERQDISLLESAITAPQRRMREDIRRLPNYLQTLIQQARMDRRRSSTFFPQTARSGRPMSVHVPGRGLTEFSKKSGRGGSGGNKDIDRIVGQVLGQGWKLEAGKKHRKLISPSGAPVFYPSSASDRRALQNFISTLRKKGAVVDGRGYGGKEGKGGPSEMSRRSGGRPVAETAFGFVPDRRLLEAIRRGEMSFGQEIGAQRLNTKRLSTTVSLGGRSGPGRYSGTAIAMFPENDRGLIGGSGREVGRLLGQGDRKTRRTKLSPYSPMAEKVYEVLGGMLGAPTPAVVRRRLTPLEQQLATGGRLPQVGSSARTNIGKTRRVASGKFQHPQSHERRPMGRYAWMIPWLDDFQPMKGVLRGHPTFDDEIRTQATRQLGSTRDMRRIMLLDQILGQTDRHGSNMMVGKGRGGKRRILGIDNEHMFSMRGLDRPISDLDRQLNNTPQFSSFSARYMPRDVPQGGGTLLPWMTKGTGSGLSRIKLTKQEQDASAREAKTLRGILGGKRSMKIVEESFLTAGYSKRDTDRYMETLRTRLEAAAITRESEAASGHSDAGDYSKMLQMSRRSGAQRRLASRTRATGRGVMLPHDLPGGDFLELPRPLRLLGEMLHRKEAGRIARPVEFEDETRSSLVAGKTFTPGRASQGSRPVIPKNLAGRSPEQIFAEQLVASHNAGMRVREIGPDPERLINAQLQAMGVSVEQDGNVRRMISRSDQMTAARALQVLRRQQLGMGSIASFSPGSVGVGSRLRDQAVPGDQRNRADLIGQALDEMGGFDAFREVVAGTSLSRRDRRSGQSGNRRIGLTGGFIATAPNRFYVPGMDDAAGLRNLVVGAMTHRMPGTHEQGKLGGLAGLGVPGIGTSLMAYELRRHARAIMEARRRYPGALEAKYGVTPEDLSALGRPQGSPRGLSLKASGSGMGLYEALGFSFSDPVDQDGKLPSRFMHMGGHAVVDTYEKIRAEIKRVEAGLAAQGIAYSPMEFARRSGKAWTDPNLEDRRTSISSRLVPMISDPGQLRVAEEDLLGPFTRGTRFKLQSETYTSGPSAGKPIVRPKSHRGVKYYTATTPGGIKIVNIPEDIDRGRLQQLIASTETMRRKYPDKSFQVNLQYGKTDRGAMGTADIGGSLMELRDSLFSEFAEQTTGWRTDFEILAPENPNQVREHYGPWEEGKRRKFRMVPGPEGRHQDINTTQTLVSHEFGHLFSPDEWGRRLWKEAGFQGTMAGASTPYLDFRRKGKGASGEYGDMATISRWHDQGRSPGGAIKDFLLPYERINSRGSYQGAPGYFGGEYSPGSKANKEMLGSQAPLGRNDIFASMMRKIGELMVIGEYGPLAAVLPRYQRKTTSKGQTRMPGDTKFQTIEEAMDELWKIGGYRNAETTSPATEWYASMFERYHSRGFGQPGSIPKHNMLGYRVARMIGKNSGWAEYSKRSGGIGGMLGGLFGRGRPNIMQQITGGQTYGMTLEDLLGGEIMPGMGKAPEGFTGATGKQIFNLKTMAGEIRQVLAQPIGGEYSQGGRFPNKAMEILAGLLGVETPTILERSIGGRRLAIQPIAPADTASRFVQKRNAPPSKRVDVWEDDEIIGFFSQPLGPSSDDPDLRKQPWLASRGGRRMQILDHIAQTFDRHNSNYLLNLIDPQAGLGQPENYRVTAIDHDLTLSPPGTGVLGRSPYQPASNVPIGIPGQFRGTQTKLAREEAATLAGVMTRRKVIEPQLLEALRAGGYSEQEALATVDAIFRRAREAFRSRMAESRGAARPDGRELSRRSGGGGMNGLTNPFAEYSKRSGGAATKDPYASLQTAFEQVTLTAIKNLKVSLAGQKVSPQLLRSSFASFQQTILDAATGQGEFAGGSMQKALRGIAPKARKSLMGMFSGILQDMVDTGTAAFKRGDLKGIPLRKVLFGMLGSVPSTYAPDIAQIAANPALQGKKPSGQRDRIPGIAGINKYAAGLQQLGGIPIASGLRLAGSATLDQHLLDQGFNPENYRGRAGIVTDLIQKYMPGGSGIPAGLRFTDTLTPDRNGQSSWGNYMPSRGAGMVGPGTAYPDDRVGQISVDLGSQGGMRRTPEGLIAPHGLERSTVTIGKLLATTAHEITHRMVDEAQLEAAKLSIGKTDAEKEEILKKVTAARGVPQKDKYRAYSGISGEYMFVPKGSAPIAARPIPLGSGQNPEGYSYMELPKGSITESQYKALSPKDKASYEKGYVTADQARAIDKNAGGQHINVPGHFGPQVAMLDDFGAGVTEYAQLLAASTRILQPGETEASLLRTTAQMNAGSRANITSFSAATPGVAGVLNPFQGGLLKAFDLSKATGVGSSMKPVAEFLGALQRNMSSQMTDAAAAGGLDPKDLGSMFAKALEKAIEATPKGERSSVLSAIRPDRMLDAAVILDSIGRAKNIPALTRMIDAGGALPAVSSPHGILASDAETDADVQKINRELAGEELARGGKSRKAKPAPGPAPTPGAGPGLGSLPPDRMAVISPKGADLLSKLTEILSMGLSGGGKENIPLRKLIRAEAGLPDRPLRGTQLARYSGTSVSISALAEQYPELLPFVREYRPEHPLLGPRPGTRLPATKRGRRGSVIQSRMSTSTAIQPYVDPIDPDYYQNQADAIFASRVKDAFDMLGGEGGFGYTARGMGNRINVLRDVMPEDQLQGGLDKLKQFGATMKDAFLNSKPVVGLMQDFDDAVLRAADGSLDFSKSLDAATASSGGLVNQLKETVKLAVAFVLTQNAANAIYRSISHLSSGFIQFNQSLEDAKVGFSTLFNNAGDSMGVAEGRATGMIERLKEFANVTPFYFTQLQEASVRMQAFGLDIGKVLQRDPVSGELVGYIKNIGDAVAALGGGDEKIMRITYALGQMNSAGRVYQNDMMQLANAGIAGYEILADALINELEAKGKDMTNEDKKILNELYTNRIEAIRKLTTSGRISGKASAAAILSGLGEKYGGGMERLSKTMTGALSTVSDMSQSLVATLTGPLYNAIRDLVVEFAGVLQKPETLSIFVEMGQKLQGFASTVKEAIPATIATIVNAFTYLGGIIAKVFGGSGTASAIDLLRSGMQTVGDLLSNNVVRAALLASVALKAMMSVVSANPLVATIGIVLAALGALRQAYESNFLGFADTVDNAMAPLAEMGPDIAESIIPALKELIAAAAQVIGGGLVIALKAALPIISALASALGGMAGILEKLAPLIGAFMGAWIVKKVAIEGMAILFTKLQNAAASAAMAAGVAGVEMSSWGKPGATYYSQKIPVRAETVQTEDGPVTVYRSAAPERGAGAISKGVSIGDADKARGAVGGHMPFEKMWALPPELAKVRLPYLSDEGILDDRTGRLAGLDPHSMTAQGARPENMVLRSRSMEEILAESGQVTREQIVEARKQLRGDQGLQRAGLIDVSEVGEITVSEQGKKFLRDKLEAERERRAFDNDISVQEQVKRDQAEAASIRQANKEGQGVLGYVPKPIPDYALTPAQLTPEQELSAIRGLKGRTFKEGFTYNYVEELSKRHAAAREAGRYRTGLDGSEIPNIGLTGKLRAGGVAAVRTIADMFAMGGKTEMLGESADRFGSLAMAASGLMVGFEALGSTIGISSKEMQGVSTALMGLAIVSKGVAAAMAGISAAGGVKNALGGLLGSMGGPIGASIMAAMAGAVFVASEVSKHEAEAKAYKDQRKADKEREKTVAANWDESGLGYQTAKMSGGEALYDVYGFSDGKTLGGNMGQSKIDELVAQGLFKQEATAIPGRFTYTPTEAGRAKGYISAKGLTQAAIPKFAKATDEVIENVDKLLVSSTGGLMEATPAERMGQDNADKLQTLLAAGIIDEETVKQIVGDIRSEDNASFWTSVFGGQLAPGRRSYDPAMSERYGKAYDNAFDKQVFGLFSTFDPKDMLSEYLNVENTNDRILKNYKLQGQRFTGEYAKEGVPNEAIFSTSETLKLLNESLEDASKALDKAKEKLSKLFDPFATAFEQLMGRAKELLQQEFQLEQEQLNAEMEDALYNVDALYNGETMRLGVLEEQYKLLQEQKAEQEKLNALNDAQENAARATLGLFDAQQDPIQAAIAAREAAQKLQKEEQNYQLNQMSESIEQAKSSVQYQQTTTYYDEKKETLTADQAERSRRLEERAQQLLKDIQEGKITVAAAQEEFMAMFGDAGLPLESILATGQFQGESLADIMGTAFATRFQELGDIIATTMADVVKAGIAAAAAEANVDAIVAQIDKVENMKDKIKKKEVEAERDRMKQVLIRSQAALTAYSISDGVKDTDAATKALGAVKTLESYIDDLNNMDFKTYGEYLTRAQFGTEFDKIYAMMDKIYSTFGALQTIAPANPGPRAQGGGVGAGQYIVGERGPEMLTMFPDGGGYVTPNHELPNSIQSSAGALKAGRQGRYYGGLVGVTGRAGGGYVGPVGKDDPFWSPTDSFRRSLGFIGDPMGFQQHSFNEFMANPNNTKAEKNELIRRYPKNYARYVASKIRGGGRMGWTPVMGRAMGGYVGAGRGPMPMDDVVVEPPIPPEPPITPFECPPGYIKVWSEGGYSCEKITPQVPKCPPGYTPIQVSPGVWKCVFTSTTPTPDPETTTMPFNWRLYPMLLNGLQDIAANVEFPYTVDPKTGTSRPIPGVRTQIFAPRGPGEGGDVNILRETPSGQFGDEVTQAAGGPVRMELKPGPNHGGEVGAVVRGGTGWQYKYGWFAQLAKLPFIKGTPLADLLLQPARLLPHLKPNELGILKTVGDPNVSPQSKGAKFYPEGVGGKGRGLLEDFFKHSNLIMKAERAAYPFWRGGSLIMSGYGWAADINDAQEKDGDWWEKKLEQVRIEEMSEAYWVNKKREWERDGSLESRNDVAGLIKGLGMTDAAGGFNFTESVLGLIDPNRKYDILKNNTIADGLASGDFNIGQPIVLSDETKAEIDRTKEPLARTLFRVATGITGEALTAVKLAFSARTGRLDMLASAALTTGGYEVGKDVGGKLWDLPGGIADVVGAVAPFIGHVGKLGWEHWFGPIDPAGQSYEDLVKQNKQDYGIPSTLSRAFFDSDLLMEAEKEGMQDKMLSAKRMIIPEFMWRPEGMGQFQSASELFSLMGMEPRWIKNFTEMLPGGLWGYREWSKVMPKMWNPGKGGTGSTMAGGRSVEPVARAFGGSIGKNMPYLVGERGPELMIPDSSGYMLPNTGLQALQAPGDLRMAGGGATINASVTINNPVVSDAADIDKLAEKVSSAQVRTLRAAGFMRPS